MRKDKKDWILYCRSILITTGLGFFVFSIWFSINIYNTPPNNAVLTYGVLLVFVGFGSVLFYAGLCSSDKKAKLWANAATVDILSIFTMIIAYPVYKLLKFIKWPKSNV